MSVLAVEERIERRPMTYTDYLTFASESQKMEWVNNEVLIYVSASTKHQRLVVFILWLLEGFCKRFQLGEVLPDPFACQLWEGGPVREPDIAFISSENLDKLDEQRLYGAPDLVVEIISPSSVTEDNVNKFQDYQKAGVREYWIIDPRYYYQTVEMYRLNEDGLFIPVLPDDEGRFMSAVLPHFWIDSHWLWERPLPEPQLKLAEIMITVPTLSAKLRATYQMIYDTFSE